MAMIYWYGFLLVAFGSTAACIVLLYVWGGIKLRVLAACLALVWLYHAQWQARAMWNVRWVDDIYSTYQQDALIQAIQAKQFKVPLKNTTNFNWHTVCRLGGYQRYAAPQGQETPESKILKDVLGTDFISEIELSLLGIEHYILVYATLDDFIVIQPFWGRFSRDFQKNFTGRYYYEKFNGNGYWVNVMFNTDNNQYANLCFKPEDIWFEIIPEPEG